MPGPNSLEAIGSSRLARGAGPGPGPKVPTRNNYEKKNLNIYLKNMFGKLNCFKLILNIFRYILIIILCHVLSIL